MPNRHVPRQKSASHRSSTSPTKNKTKANKKRAVRHQRERKSPAATKSTRASVRRERGNLVVADMLGDLSLSFTATARKHKVDPRWVLKHLGSNFQKNSSGRIRAKATKTRYKTLYKPTATPGVHLPVVTKSKRERRLLGEWMAALNAAGRNDWSRLRKFPKQRRIGGVLLETDVNEVQAILRALAEEESPFEGLYRTTVRPS